MKRTIDISDTEYINRLFQTALKSGLNFFCYRKPDEKGISFGASERVLPDISENAYVIVPFDNRAEGIMSIPAEIDPDIIVAGYESGNSDGLKSDGLYPMPERSTSRKEHREEILTFKSIINGNPHHKIIAARAIRANGQADIADTFIELCESYPSAYVFLFYTGKSGCWLGASPETVLRCESGMITAMSLAGTRKAGTEGEWDEKNIKEQKIVTDYIADLFQSKGLTPVIGYTMTRQAGPVEHLCTIITCNDQSVSLEKRKNLLLSLSPTPALNGYPASIAFDAIMNAEGNRRGYYGGFSGWIDDADNFDFFVNLRSMRITEDGWCLYAGGGITCDSDPDKEWEETEIKASTLADKIKFIEKR